MILSFKCLMCGIFTLFPALFNLLFLVFSVKLVNSRNALISCSACNSIGEIGRNGPLPLPAGVETMEQGLDKTKLSKWEVLWPNGYCVGLWIERFGFQPWPGSLCCVLGQDTFLSLSTQEYEWVPTNCPGNLTKMLGVTCDGLAGIPSRE